MRVATARQQSAPPTPVGNDVRGRDEEPARKRFARVLVEADFASKVERRRADGADPATAERRDRRRARRDRAPPGRRAPRRSDPDGRLGRRLERVAAPRADRWRSGIVLDDELERRSCPPLPAMLAGQLSVPTALGRQIAPRPLSHREKQILALVMAGLHQSGDRRQALSGREHGQDAPLVGLPQARRAFAVGSGDQDHGPGEWLRSHDSRARQVTVSLPASGP